MANAPEMYSDIILHASLIWWRIIVYCVQTGPKAGPSEAGEGDSRPKAEHLGDLRSFLSWEVKIILRTRMTLVSMVQDPLVTT